MSGAKPGPGHNSAALEKSVKFLAGAVRRIEQLDEEIRAANAAKSDIYKEAKGHGFDPAAVRGAIRWRRDPDTAEERSQAVQNLLELLDGVASAGVEDDGPMTPSRARARARARGDEP